jgi:hypothetical protein
MMNIGKLDDTETPTAQEVTDCADFLNMLVKQWQGTADFAPGLKTWTRRRGHLFLSGVTGQYTLGPNGTGWTTSYINTTSTATAAGGQPNIVLASVAGLLVGDNFGTVLDSGTIFWSNVLSINTGTKTVTLSTNLPSQASAGTNVFDYTTTATQPIVIEACVLRDIFNSDTPVKILTQPEYDLLPSKTNPQFISDPTAIYYEFQLANSNLFTDCSASNDVTKHLVITYLEAIQDFNNPNDTPEYPQEWFLPLALNLSKIIAPMFNAKWTDLMNQNAATALAIAQKKEPFRTTMYFQPGEDGL